jgi:aryl-alcohol dehydrogenase-like predicted oxidoreductase
MNYRVFGKTGWKVSEIGFGAWAIGGSWGSVPRADADAALDAAIDSGVNFVDTADVYGDGTSERIIADLLKRRDERIYVATKLGRRLNPHAPEGYNLDQMEAFIDRSLTNLGVDQLDLVQLHCPPTQVFYQPETFEALEHLVEKGKIAHYGVSVEKVEEAVKAAEYEHLASVQIIFNMFRQRPADDFFRIAKEREIAVIVRVPLASGLLTGKFTASSEFAKDDHRNFNRHGEAFDRGETFAGVDYETGLAVVDELRELKPAEATMAQFALRWILGFDAVSVIIPGAKNPDQARANAAASDLAPLDWKTLDGVRRLYNERVKDQVHHRW